MRSALIESGYTVRVFAEGIHPACASIVDPVNLAPRKLWQSPDDILIYHHSTGWPRGEEILFNTQNRVILRYHNVTPVRFFAPYSSPHTQANEFVDESTKRIANLPNILIMEDATYYCQDLNA